MTRELILHIGTTKTGSTSIQYVLDTKCAEMAAQGVYWPETHGAKRHLLLALANSKAGHFHESLGNPLWQGMEPAARLAAYRTEFAKEMNELSENIARVVISAEQFSEQLRTKSEIENLHAMLAPHFSKMSVVVYLRRQDSHYGSMHAQFLRMGNLQTPDLSAVKIGFGHDYDYLDLLDRWADIFGVDAVQPRLFERTGDRKFDVVDDFIALCGLDLTLSADDQRRARNPSMNLVGQKVLLKTGELIREKNGDKPMNGYLWNRIAQSVTNAAPGRGWLPTQAQAQAFMARFAASNEAVRERWFPKRETLFAMNMSDLPVEEVVEDPAAEFRGACAALLDACTTGMQRQLQLWLQIAKLAEAAGDHKRMKAALAQVIRLESRNIPARIQMVEHHIEQGNLNAARASLNVAGQIAPEDPAIRRLEKRLTDLGVAPMARARPASARAPGGPGARKIRKEKVPAAQSQIDSAS